ncbi:MAG: hypothetical protein AAF387_07445 [Pseudomonadota bacterium]
MSTAKTNVYCAEPGCSVAARLCLYSAILASVDAVRCGASAILTGLGASVTVAVQQGTSIDDHTLENA